MTRCAQCTHEASAFVILAWRGGAGSYNLCRNCIVVCEETPGTTVESIQWNEHASEAPTIRCLTPACWVVVTDGTSVEFGTEADAMDYARAITLCGYCGTFGHPSDECDERELIDGGDEA